MSVQTDHFSGRRVWREGPGTRIVARTFTDLSEAQDMEQMLQTQDRHRLRSTPPQEADHNPAAESELTHTIVRHLTTIRGDTTKVIPLFSTQDGTPTIADPAGRDSRSRQALRGWLVQ